MKRKSANDNSNSSSSLPFGCSNAVSITTTTSSSNYRIDIQSMGELQLDGVIQMNNFGVCSIESSDYDQAIDFFGQALDMANSETTTYFHKSDASSSSNIISIYVSNNKPFPESVTTFLVSKATISPLVGLSASSISGGSELKNDTNVSLGKLFCDEYDVGMNTFSVPILLDANKNIIVPAVIATILFNLGQSYLRKNKNEDAFASFTKSYEIAQWIQMQSSTNGPDALIDCCLRSESKGISRSAHFASSNNAMDNVQLYSNHGTNATSLQDMISLDGCASIMTILHNIGYIQYRTGQYEEARNTYARALHLGNNSFYQSIQDKLQIAATLNCLGVIFYHLPKPKIENSMDLYRESLAKTRSVYCIDAETKEIATILNNIGRIHYMKDELDQALELYQQSMKMRRRLLGDDHIDVAAIIYNAALAHHQRGDLEEAMRLCKEFLIIAGKQLGTHHRDVATMLKCMAQIHHKRKEYTEAVTLYQEALDTGKAYFGSNFHPEGASTLNKLGDMYNEKGDYASAIRVYKEALEVERTVLDVFHPNVVVTLSNIGQIHKLQGDCEAALCVYREAVAIQRHSLGASHPNIATTLSPIALIHYQSRNFTKSLDVYQEALRIRRDAFGDNGNLEVATNLNSIGSVLFKMELHDVAMQSFLESLRIRRRVLGPDYLVLVDDMALYEEFLIAARKKRLGTHHPDVAILLKEMEQIHYQERKECNTEEVAAPKRQLLGMAVLIMKMRATIRILIIITLFIISSLLLAIWMGGKYQNYYFSFLYCFLLSLLLLLSFFFYLPKIITKQY